MFKLVKQFVNTQLRFFYWNWGCSG